MSQPIRIAIVEDDAGLRETLQQVFGAAPDFKVVGTFGDGESAARQLPGKTPDVVLMDINLPGMSGIDCLRQLKAGMPRVRVIMVTVYDDNDNLFQSLVAGADGYLLKRATRLRLLDSVREIVGGGAPISPSVARRMVEYFHHLNDPASPKPAQAVAASLDLRGLTGREREVLGKLAEGFAPKEVASELGISWDTVRNHVTNIYAKLHVHSCSEAILKYLGRTPGTEQSHKL
ncbi:MAG: response regulator transcription factor [Verrucomicrobiota bacterium]|nr:response regulator transcription factor [Verrucomicrobiota bacterium]